MSDKLIGCVQHDCNDCKRREQEMAELKAQNTALQEGEWRAILNMSDEQIRALAAIEHHSPDDTKRIVNLSIQIATMEADHARIIASWKAEEEQWRKMNDELRAKIAADNNER